jgi:hypothetical protein
MARGWESKAIESQQDDAQARRRLAAATSGPATPEEQEALDRRRSLQLARARAEADLQAATRPAHQEMLRQALAAIDARLAVEMSED